MVDELVDIVEYYPSNVKYLRAWEEFLMVTKGQLEDETFDEYDEDEDDEYDRCDDVDCIG